MKQLKFNLHRKWFDMILSGQKKEEYREITPYYISQLFNWKESGCTREDFVEVFSADIETALWFYLKDFKGTIIFYNGYRKNRPSFEIDFDSIEIGTGRPEWGAVPGKLYFVFYLGDVRK